jgi:hypothetical protein
MSTRTGLVPLSSIMALGSKNLDLDTLAPKAGSVTYVEDEPQPAALSGQEQPVTDLVGGKQVAPPSPSAGAPATPPKPPAGPEKPAAAGSPPSFSKPEAASPVAKELNSFSRFAKARTDRPWRDFAFTEAAPFIAELLNAAGKSDAATAALLAQQILTGDGS